MFQVVGEYYRENFVDYSYVKSGNIYSNIDDRSAIILNNLCQFIRRIKITDGNLDIFRSHHFHLLKEIEFYGKNLTSIEQVRTVLANEETLKFSYCELYVRNIDQYSQQQNIFIGTSNDWLANQYPTLERFDVITRRKSEDVIQFLKHNPNIRKLTTTIDFLIANRNSFFTCHIELDVLGILDENNN